MSTETRFKAAVKSVEGRSYGHSAAKTGDKICFQLVRIQMTVKCKEVDSEDTDLLCSRC